MLKAGISLVTMESVLVGLLYGLSAKTVRPMFARAYAHMHPKVGADELLARGGGG
jgi:hypothetical protein